MHRILFLFTCFTTTIVFGQSEARDTTKWQMQIFEGDTVYSRKPSAGDLAREVGEIDKAITLYKKDIADDPTDKTMLYNLASAYALQEGYASADSAMYYLNLATATDTSVVSLTDPDFYALIDLPIWDAYVDQIVVKIEAKFGKYENIELSKELWEMSLKDQAFYYHLQIVGYESVVSNAIWELKRRINTKNLERLENIVETYGWPKSSVVGGNAATAAFLIIQHTQELAIQQKYLPIIKDAANAGEAEWSSLALLIDRVKLSEGKPQIYGSQIGINEKGEYFVDNLEDPEYVNQRRNEVGLGSIQEYVSIWNIEWNIVQKKK